MYFVTMRKLYFLFTSIFLIVTILSICRGTFFNVSVSQIGSVFLSNASNAEVTQAGPCFGVISPTLEGLFHIDDFVLQNAYVRYGDIFLTAFLLTFLLLPRKKIVHVFESYIRTIRTRYGDWQVFHTIKKLFRIGILHPKIH